MIMRSMKEIHTAVNLNKSAKLQVAVPTPFLLLVPVLLNGVERLSVGLS